MSFGCDRLCWERTFRIRITEDILERCGFHSISEIGECVLSALKTLV